MNSFTESTYISPTGIHLVERRPAVSRVDDILQVRRHADAEPQMCRVIDFHDVFAAVVKRAVTKGETLPIGSGGRWRHVGANQYVFTRARAEGTASRFQLYALLLPVPPFLTPNSTGVSLGAGVGER